MHNSVYGLRTDPGFATFRFVRRTDNNPETVFKISKTMPTTLNR